MKTISKILSIVLCLAMVMALFVVGASAAENTYTKVNITSASDITAGTYIIGGEAGSAIDDGSKYAYISNTVTSNRLKGTALTATNGSITTSNNAVVWNLVEANGGFYLQSAANNQYVKQTDNKKVSLVANASDATIWKVVSYNGGYTLENASNTNGYLTANRFGSAGSYYLGFAPYTASSSSCPCKLDFYKLSSGSVESCNHEGTGRVSVKDATNHWSTCQECGALVGEKAPHTFTNGTCSCGYSEIATPVAGTTYKAGTFQANLGKTLYITGKIKNDRFLATTETRAEGVDVTVEAATGGFYLSFMDGTAKKYIDLQVTDSAQGYVNVKITDAPTVVYTFDATHKTFVATLTTEKYGEDIYFIGANGTYDTLGSSYDGNLATYFPLYLYAIETTGNEGTGNEGTGNEGTGNEGTGNEGAGNEGGNTQTPVAPKPFVPSTGVDTPVAGTAFKLGLYQKNVEKYLYFNNTTPSADRPYYQGTTDKFSEAVDVFVEAVEGGYKLYFMNGTTKTYIDIYQNGNYVNLRLTTEPTAVFTWNTEHKTFVTKIGETEYYIGTYDKFETISACKLSKIAESFASHLYAKEPAKTGDNSVISVAVAAAVLSVMGAAVLVSKKKEF